MKYISYAPNYRVAQKKNPSLSEGFFLGYPVYIITVKMIIKSNTFRGRFPFIDTFILKAIM